MNQLTLENLVEQGLFLGRYEKEDVLPVSGMRVGIPYLLLTQSNIPVSSIVIKCTKLSRSNVLGLGDFNYFIYNNLEGHKYVEKLTSGSRLVSAYDVTINNMKLKEGIISVSADVPLGLMTSKFPTEIPLANLTNLKNSHEVFIKMEMLNYSALSVELVSTSISTSRVIIPVMFDRDSVITTEWLNFNPAFEQQEYLESIKTSDVAHFAQQDFMNMVFNKVPTRLIIQGALTPQAVVYFLVKLIGKSLVQNMYNNRDFTTSDLDKLLPEAIPALTTMVQPFIRRV